MKIREMQPDDIPFVLQGWRKSFADSDLALLCTPKDDAHVKACAVCGAFRVRLDGPRVMTGASYWDGQRALIQKLLARSKTLVAESNVDGFPLLDGFATIEGDILHYVYVRKSARGRGVAKALLSSLGGSVTFTHKPRFLQEKRLPAGWRYNPYEAWV